MMLSLYQVSLVHFYLRQPSSPSLCFGLVDLHKTYQWCQLSWLRRIVTNNRPHRRIWSPNLTLCHYRCWFAVDFYDDDDDLSSSLLYQSCPWRNGFSDNLPEWRISFAVDGPDESNCDTLDYQWGHLGSCPSFPLGWDTPNRKSPIVLPPCRVP